MDYELTEEQQRLQGGYRDFVERCIAPDADRWDREDICPSDLMPSMGEHGILGAFAPKEYGGEGYGHLERALALVEIARHSAGVAMMVYTHQLSIGALLEYGTEGQKRKYLPRLCAGRLIGGLGATEPGGGSDIAGTRTSATKDGEYWVINGRKCFITNSHIADICIINARIGEDEKGRGRFGAFLLEKGMKGFRPGTEEKKLGFKGSVTGELVMDNVRVPAANMVGPEGKGNAVALKAISEVGRSSMAAICVGLLRGCLELSVRFAGGRVVYGKPISKLQAIQFQIAENRVDYEAAKALLYRVAALEDRQAAATAEFSVAKLFAVQAAIRAAERTIGLMGGYGISDDYPVGRYMRDALACAPSGGTSEIQKVIIAGDTLKGFAQAGGGAAAKAGGARAAEEIAGDADEAAERIIAVIRGQLGKEKAESAVQRAEDAELIVCGGYGIKEKSLWRLLKDFAENLGGVACCTRPALEAGFMDDRSRMVGATGKSVSPKVYVGIGVSGAANHVCGIKGSGVIIGVNSDPIADIFRDSDYKAVMDAARLLPVLAAKSKECQGE